MRIKRCYFSHYKMSGTL